MITFCRIFMSLSQTITFNYNSFTIEVPIQGEKHTDHLVSSLEIIMWIILVNSHLIFFRNL